MGLDSFLTHLQPRIREQNTEVERALIARRAIIETATALDEVVTQSSVELGDGNITPKRASDMKRAAAKAAMQRIDGEIAQAVVRAENAATEVGLQQSAAVQKLVDGFGPFEAARAATGAQYLLTAATDADRKSFAESVRGGVRDACVVAAALPSFGPFAGLRDLARTQLLRTAYKPDEIAKDRRIQLAAVIVRQWFDDLRGVVSQLAATGEVPDISARALLERANSADWSRVLAESVQLGLIEQPSVSTAEPTSVNRGRLSARDLMLKGNRAAGEGS